MSVMIVNRNNVFNNLSKIISLLDAYEEVKISYVASDGNGASDETSFGGDINNFKPPRRSAPKPGARAPREYKTDDRRSRPSPREPTTSRAPRSRDGEHTASRSYGPRTSARPTSRTPRDSNEEGFGPKTYASRTNKKGNPGKGYKKTGNRI